MLDEAAELGDEQVTGDPWKMSCCGCALVETQGGE